MRRSCWNAASCDPEGWYRDARLEMSVDFRALTEPHYAATGTRGHFEQTGEVTGAITIGGTTTRVSGYGVRDKSWGPRDWGAAAPAQSDRRLDETVRAVAVRQLVLDELRRGARARRFVWPRR